METEYSHMTETELVFHAQSYFAMLSPTMNNLSTQLDTAYEPLVRGDLVRFASHLTFILGQLQQLISLVGTLSEICHAPWNRIILNSNENAQ